MKVHSGDDHYTRKNMLLQVLTDNWNGVYIKKVKINPLFGACDTHQPAHTVQNY